MNSNVLNILPPGNFLWLCVGLNIYAGLRLGAANLISVLFFGDKITHNYAWLTAGCFFVLLLIILSDVLTGKIFATAKKSALSLGLDKNVVRENILLVLLTGLVVTFIASLLVTFAFLWLVDGHSMMRLTVFVMPISAVLSMKYLEYILSSAGNSGNSRDMA